MTTLSLRVRLSRAGFALDVDETVPLSGLTAVFGPSGAGKSTLLRAVAGLETAAAGRIALGDEVWQDAGIMLPAHRRGVGYVFQDTRLFAHLSVAGNLRFAARRAAGRGGPGVEEVVAALGLGDLLRRSPDALSGGERQRVAIGRALLAAPRLLLMDEPLAALDDTRKAAILPYIERLRDDGRVPILYVSHSVTEVARLADRIMVLRGGRVQRHGPAEAVLSDPASVPSLGLREAGAILEGRVVAHHEDGLSEIAVSAGRLFLPHVGLAPGARLRVRIAAKDVILSRAAPEGLSALNVLPGTVSTVRAGEGPGAAVQIRAGEDRLLARVTRRSVASLGLAPGVTCHAIVKTLSVARADVGHPPVPGD